MTDHQSTFNLTAYGWVNEPNGRGTWTILSTCLLTIFLCCWTSLCPNIPAPQDGYFTQLRDQLHMALMGILGPEFLLMLVLGEWSSARESVKVRQLTAMSLKSEGLTLKPELPAVRIRRLEYDARLLCRYGWLCSGRARYQDPISSQCPTASFPRTQALCPVSAARER